jgi:hypothetical protein
MSARMVSQEGSGLSMTKWRKPCWNLHFCGETHSKSYGTNGVTYANNALPHGQFAQIIATLRFDSNPYAEGRHRNHRYRLSFPGRDQ